MAAGSSQTPRKRAAPEGQPAARQGQGDKQIAYLVLGMHRSGTSAVSHLLSLAGAELPKNLMPADENNEKGYFEPWKIAVFNDERLRAAGAAWDDVFAYPFRPLARRDERRWLNRATELFDEEYGEATRPLLKDPRVTVLLPFWRTLFDDLEIAARCVIPVRHPMAVAGSLERRNGFPLEKSLLLWSAYMLAAEAYSRDLPRVFVSYDALLADWRGEVARIEAAHGAPLPDLNDAAGRAIDEALSPDLRHNAAPEGGELPGWPGAIAQQVLDWCNAAARGETPNTAPLDAATDELRRRRDEIGALVSPVTRDLDVMRGQMLDLRNRLELERVSAEARERELIETMQRDRATLESGWKADLERQQAELAAERAKLEASWKAEFERLEARWQQELKAAAAREAELKKTMDRDRQVLESGWKTDVERLSQQHQELETELERMRRSWAELGTRLDSVLAEA